MNSSRIIISGGGTGGHIYPAIAIAHALKEMQPDVELLFVGALGKMEMEKVPKAGFPIVGLPVVGLQRSLSPANFLFPIRLLKSLRKAAQIIKDFQPQVAVGVGGFASGPLLQMASLKGIPTLIQEQNSHAGLTNKLLARKAARICVAYPDMEKFFPKNKILLTGNPVRQDILELEGKRNTGMEHFGLDPEKKTLFVMGGSLGAKTINESIVTNLAALAEQNIQVVWQTGKLFIDEARRKIAALGLGQQIKAFEFIYEMDLAYAVADLVVSRAGALSVSEICLAGKPSILVPYPYAAEDHQTSNARALVERKAALMVADSQAGELLYDTIVKLTNDPSLREELSQNCRPLGFPDASRRIAAEILKLI